tara:strand:- start:526 stop:660 length:135 start_codon:yes stop_codon:yes gene_type:complete
LEFGVPSEGRHGEVKEDGGSQNGEFRRKKKVGLFLVLLIFRHGR